MAERNRRGRGAADDDEPIEDVTSDREETRGGTAVKARPATRAPRFGLFRWIGRFIREVVAELRKVIWPTRKELVTYAAVVVVFIARDDGHHRPAGPGFRTRRPGGLRRLTVRTDNRRH